MKTRNRSKGRATLCAPLRDEGGMILVISMIILLVVSTLAAANLINAFLERSLAKNQNYASVALNAADAGIAESIAWLAEKTNRATITYGNDNTAPYATWSHTFTPGNLANSGGRYEVTLALIPDAADLDEDGITNEPILYNTRFKYVDAKASADADSYPIIKIDSKGYLGNSATDNRGFREIEMYIARDKPIPPGVRGAVTSKDGVAFKSSSAQNKDGTAHDIDGHPCTDPGIVCDCNSSTAAIYTELEHQGQCTNDPQCTTPSGCSCIGKAGTTHPNATIDAGPITETLCDSAECVLDYDTRTALEAAAKAKGKIFGPGAGETPISDAAIDTYLLNGPEGALVIVKGAYTIGVGGVPGNDTVVADGIKAKTLIVDGTFDSKGNTGFRGLIIAKNFATTGNLVVNGAVVATGDTSSNLPFANGGVQLQYSCDAIAAASGQSSFSTRLTWHRVH